MTLFSAEWPPKRVASYLNRLQRVEWDRCISSSVEDVHSLLVVYGWIGRPDGYFDYVQMEFASWSDEPGFATSSATYSAEMHALIYGRARAAEHNPCVRVCDVPELAASVERRIPWG